MWSFNWPLFIVVVSDDDKQFEYIYIIVDDFKQITSSTANYMINTIFPAYIILVAAIFVFGSSNNNNN